MLWRFESPAFVLRGERALALLLLETVHDVTGPPLPGGENPRVLDGSHDTSLGYCARSPVRFFAPKSARSQNTGGTLLLTAVLARQAQA